MVAGGGASALAHAFERQYSFWRLIGVISLAILGLYALILVGGIVFWIFAAASGG